MSEQITGCLICSLLSFICVATYLKILTVDIFIVHDNNVIFLCNQNPIDVGQPWDIIIIFCQSSNRFSRCSFSDGFAKRKLLVWSKVEIF